MTEFKDLSIVTGPVVPEPDERLAIPYSGGTVWVWRVPVDVYQGFFCSWEAEPKEQWHKDYVKRPGFSWGYDSRLGTAVQHWGQSFRVYVQGRIDRAFRSAKEGMTMGEFFAAALVVRKHKSALQALLDWADSLPAAVRDRWGLG